MSLTVEQATQRVGKQPAWELANDIKRALRGVTDPKEREGFLLVLAKAEKAQRRLVHALRRIEEVLAIDPQLAAAYVLRGEVHTDQGAHDEAIAAYQQAIALRPELAEPHVGIGLVYVYTERPADAVPWLTNAVALDPTHFLATHTLGQTLLKVGKRDEAEPFVRKAAGMGHPLSASALKWTYGATLDHTQLVALAQHYWDQGQQPLCFASLDEATALPGLDADQRCAVLQAYSLKLYFAQRYAEAETKIREALALGGGADTAMRANFEGNLAMTLFRQGGADNLEAARLQFPKALALEPGNAQRLHNLGLVLLAQGKSDEALRVLLEAVAADPYHVNTHYQLGVVYVGLGDTERAKQHLIYAEQGGHQGAQELRHRTSGSNEPMDHMGNGAYYFDRGQLEQAIASFEQAIPLLTPTVEFDGDRSAINIASCHNNIGFAMTLLNNPAGKAHLEQAIAMDPLYFDAVNNLGNYHAAFGDHVAALAQFDRAGQLDPYSGSPYYNRGRVYLNQLKDYEKGIEELTRAAKLYANNEQRFNDAVYLRGKCYEALGRYADARKDYYDVYADADAERVEALM